MNKKLSKEDWIAAGFRALAIGGPKAIKIDDMAREIGATKGSFYWHFTDMKVFHAEMLSIWKARATEMVISQVEDGDHQTRLERLIDLATEGAPEVFGGKLAEPAIRAWSLHDEAVSSALAELDAARVAYIRKLFGKIPHAQDYAELFYAAFIGADDLASKGRGDAKRILSQLFVLITGALDLE